MMMKLRTHWAPRSRKERKGSSLIPKCSDRVDAIDGEARSIHPLPRDSTTHREPRRSAWPSLELHAVRLFSVRAREKELGALRSSRKLGGVEEGGVLMELECSSWMLQIPVSAWVEYL